MNSTPWRGGITVCSALPMSGLSESTWRRAIRAGSLIPSIREWPASWEPRTHRSNASPPAVLDRRWGARDRTDRRRTCGVLPRPVTRSGRHHRARRRALRRLVGVVVHRPRDHAHLAPPQRRSNIQCTNVLRTLCDLGAVDAAGVIDAVGHALAARLVTLGALETTLLAHSRPGRHGVRALRRSDRRLDDRGSPDRLAAGTSDASSRRTVHALPPSSSTRSSRVGRSTSA